MRKRISVCMLATMMSVTSMYSFVAQGAENETEQETGIEQESEELETQAEEAVDPMSADRLLIQTRVIDPTEILEKENGMRIYLQVRQQYRVSEACMMEKNDKFW